MSDEWKGFNDEQKQQYEDSCATDKKRYSDEMVKYNAQKKAAEAKAPKKSADEKIKKSPSLNQRIPKIRFHPKNLQKKKLLVKKLQKQQARHQLRLLKRMQSQNLRTRNQLR